MTIVELGNENDKYIYLENNSIEYDIYLVPCGKSGKHAAINE